MSEPLLVRAALLVALAAVAEAVLSPLLTFGWVGPRFMVLGVIIAVTGLRELQALLLGFFGGVLTDALGAGLFGVGALGGIFAAVVSVRAGPMRRKSDARPFLARTVVVAVVVYDLLVLLTLSLAGGDGPPLLNYLLGGVVPDALLNALLAYLVGGWLLKLITTKEERWA